MLESTIEVPIERVVGLTRAAARDALAVEEPLAIELETDGDAGASPARAIATVTMRTPGEDAELACGFLLGEGIVRSRGDVASVGHAGPTEGDGGYRDVVRVTLAPGLRVDLASLERRFVTTSACGVCGKTSLESARAIHAEPLPRGEPIVSGAMLKGLPAALRASQRTFDRTGGLHAAALFDPSGALLHVREDVGRHNALDKLLGALLLRGDPARGVVLVSGRASFELVQKALASRVAILAAVGAPSSLAVEAAREHGMTLVGFLREDRFNVYAGGERVA